MIFPPGVQVASTQWSATSNLVPAASPDVGEGGAGSVGPVQRRRRFLVRAETPAAATQGAEFGRPAGRRLSDAFAPYNKNARNGAHPHRVMTLTVLPYGMDDIQETPVNQHANIKTTDTNHMDNASSSKEAGTNVTLQEGTLTLEGSVPESSKNSIQTKNIACHSQQPPKIQALPPSLSGVHETISSHRLPGSELGIHIHLSDGRTERTQEGTSVSVKTEGGITTAAVVIATAQTVAPATATATVGVRLEDVPSAGLKQQQQQQQQQQRVSPDGSSSELDLTGGSVWRDILLSLSTEKRSVGVANWLLKGR
ncbi:hypothetical protein EGW08_012646 [Elysia chlorotica]|uniref:Uncharacterized protein n=1 Tax=Elysia chlorotica TaxID=188477 RepID=A0A433TDG5_ELYCH|nr:hypothetical protein EGW08_012646 [Elysia chlorotica]